MSRGTVLVVDDDRDILALVTVALEGEDYSVLTADAGPAGLKMAQDAHPDVILLDIMMPGMDGLEVTQRLRDDPGTAALPIILMSAHRALQGTSTLLPINGRLPKPFDLDNLFRVVARWMPADTSGDAP